MCNTPQSNGASVGFALAGGIFLCIGNIATQYSLAFVGLSITEVVASSITVVGGASPRSQLIASEVTSLQPAFGL